MNSTVKGDHPEEHPDRPDGGKELFLTSRLYPHLFIMPALITTALFPFIKTLLLFIFDPHNKPYREMETTWMGLGSGTQTYPETAFFPISNDLI